MYKEEQLPLSSLGTISVVSFLSPVWESDERRNERLARGYIYINERNRIDSVKERE